MSDTEALTELAEGYAAFYGWSIEHAIEQTQKAIAEEYEPLREYRYNEDHPGNRPR